MASASTDRRRRSSAASTHTSSSSGAAVAASAAAAANHKSNHKQNKSALSDDVSKRKDEGDIRARVYMISASSDEGKSNGNVKGGLCTTAFLEAMKSRSDKQKKKSKLWLSTDDGDSSIASIDIDPDAPPPPVFAWIDLLHQMRRIMDASLMDTFGPDAVLQMPELTSSRPLSVTDECAIVPPLQSLGNRRALLIGVRYKDRHRGGGGGGEHLDELVSSHPDVHNMAQYLETEHDFRPEHTIVLMDDGEHVSPTKKNIMNAIKLLVKLTKSGDIVFVHYSGHGLQIKEGWFKKSNETDGMDEAIVPVDYAEHGYIMDDDLRKELVNGMAEGVQMSVLMDCCHSGSLLDLPYRYTADQDQRAKQMDVKSTFRMLGIMSRLAMASKGGTTKAHIDKITHVKKLEEMKLEAQRVARADLELRKMTKAKHRATPIDGDLSLITACVEKENNATTNENGSTTAVAGHATTAFLSTVKDALNRGESLTMVRMLLDIKMNLDKIGAHRVPQVTASRKIDMYEDFRIVKDPNSEGAKRALLIGINYYKSMSMVTLKNCQKNCLEVKKFLHEYLGFWDKDCNILMDDETHEQPTKENILLAMEKLANDCQPGDSAFFYFAGHGGQVQDTRYGGDEEDLIDEVVYPCDTDKSGLIRDDEIHEVLVRGIRTGVKLTALMDLTHSGSLMDLPHRFNVKDEEVRRYIPATIRVISGHRDQSEDEGNHTGGLCTKAFLAALTLAGPNKTWGQLLTHMRSSMEHQLSQVVNAHHPKQLPQLTSSRRVRPSDACEIVSPHLNGTKRALFIGINYTGMGDKIEELDACHMDVKKLKRFLHDAHGLREDHCEVLMDDGKELMPTRENMMKAMRRLISRSKRGDFLFIHYCGHGGVTGENGEFDECMVPVDFDTAGLIQEEDLQNEIVRPLVDGVTMTVLLDCCHVGSMLDLPFRFGIDRSNRTRHKKEVQRPSIVSLLASSLMGKKDPGSSSSNLAAWCAALHLEDEEVVGPRRRRSSTKSAKNR